MRIFGYIKELKELWFRKDSNDVKLVPNSNTYSGATTFVLPPKTSGSDDLVGAATTQTLTNKKLDDTTTQVVDTSDPTIAIKFNAAGTTGTATTLRSNQTVNVTLDLPDTTDYLLGRISQDQGAARLKNKDLEATSVAVVNAVDTTKKMRFSPSGTTGTTTTLGSAQTADINVTLPDISDTIVGRTTTDTLTNKSISGSANTLSNIPNAATTATNANTASAIVARDASGNFSAGTITATLNGSASSISGTVGIANGGTGQTTAQNARNALLPTQSGNSGRFLQSDGTDVSWASASGGAGELNLVLNPSAADAITGWAASGAGITVARTTTNSDLPLSGAVASAIKITPVSGTDYVDYLWTMPAALKNKKLKVEWYQRPLSGYASGDLKVEIYKNTDFDYTGAFTEFPLSTDVSGTSAIPNATGKYTTTFDSDGDDYYQIRITRVSGTTALNITSVIIGPGIQPQGAVVENIKAIAMTATVGGATPTVSAYGQRVGTSIRLQFRLAIGATPGSGGSAVTMAFPAGYTPDTTVLTSSTVVGNASLDIATYGSRADAFVSGGLIYFRKATTGANITAGDITAFGEINGEIDVPIAEWAGSGTLNVAQNDVEYASNSSSADANDTSSFVYGPTGAAGVIGVTTLTTTRLKRVRFQTPIQPTDIITLEFQDNTNSGWVPVSNFRYGMIYTEQNTGSYGSGIQQVNATDVDVKFAQYAYANGATFGAAGVNWSGAVGTLSLKAWRVRKISGGQAVGFGAATTTSTGLLQPVTSMPDDLATTLGHKQYLHGTTYNGGNAPTLSATNWTTTRFVAIPYKMQDGTWRLRITGRGVLAGEANNNVKSLTIAGITAKNIADWQQALAVKVDSSTPITNNVSAYITPNSGTIVIIYNGASINMNDDYTFSGDIELDSKPTWAY